MNAQREFIKLMVRRLPSDRTFTFVLGDHLFRHLAVALLAKALLRGLSVLFRLLSCKFFQYTRLIISEKLN
jgi:hypothetical protein